MAKETRAIPLSRERIMYRGKHYELHGVALTKAGAVKEIKKLKAKGYIGRAFKVSTDIFDIGYTIYKRKAK